MRFSHVMVLESRMHRVWFKLKYYMVRIQYFYLLSLCSNYYLCSQVL